MSRHVLACAAFLMSAWTLTSAHAEDDLIFYEGNGCSQDITFTYDSHRASDDNCKQRGHCKGNNDEARSVRILKSVKQGAEILVYDSPDRKTTDDWTKITIADSSFVPPEGYCLRTFENNFLNPRDNYGIRVEYIRKNGLDGKISRVRILPGR
ncbi:hypothetical protein ABID77_004438 [Variovorax sp. PvP013]